MSCFIVNDFHINALVSFAERRRVTYYLPTERRQVETAGDGQRVAELLHRANVAAFAERYRQQPTDEALAFDYRPAPRYFAPVGIVKACDCLAYQCSDWTGWPDSEAYRVLRAIREVAIQHLPGYSEAAWELRP